MDGQSTVTNDVGRKGKKKKKKKKKKEGTEKRATGDSNQDTEAKREREGKA
jgi:hypothetical protein